MHSLLTCESLGSSPVKMSQAFHDPSITLICFNFLYFHRKVNMFKTPEMCLYLDPDVWAGCFTIILRDLFIILSRFLAGSCSLKMSKPFHDPFDQFPSRVEKVNTFKTPEIRLYFDSGIWGGCLTIILVGSFPYFKFLTKINTKVRRK